MAAVRLLLIFVSSFIAAPTFAAVVGEWRVVLLRGSTTSATITGATEQEAWDSCVQRIAAQAPGSTQWTCQTPRYVARVVADPPSVCTIPQPQNETRVQTCPVGTTGTWTQSAAYITAPFPQCWEQGPFVPAEAPIGACSTPQPPTGDWTHCANQGQRCAFTGARVVRYGVDTRWVERTFTNGVQCDNAAFGNPASGLTKTCQLRGSAEPPPPDEPPPPPPATGSATLRWTPLDTMTDGTPAALAGFRVRYGRTAEALTLSTDIANPGSTSAVVDSLASGAWFFGVTAYDTLGRESLPSNIASKVIP